MPGPAGSLTGCCGGLGRTAGNPKFCLGSWPGGQAEGSALPESWVICTGGSSDWIDRGIPVGTPSARSDWNFAMGLVGLIGFVLLIVSIFGLAFHWAPGEIPTLSFDYSVGASSITLKGISGQQVDLTLTGESIQADWASVGGLNLELSNGHGLDRTFTVAQPQPKAWGTDIYTECSDSNSSCDISAYSISTSLPVPAVTPGETLTGNLAGDISSPQPNTADPFSFYNVTKKLNIPVRMQVVASLPRENVTPWGSYALISLGLCIVSWAWFRWKRRARPR